MLFSEIPRLGTCINEIQPASAELSSPDLRPSKGRDWIYRIADKASGCMRIGPQQKGDARAMAVLEGFVTLVAHMGMCSRIHQQYA